MATLFSNVRTTKTTDTAPREAKVSHGVDLLADLQREDSMYASGRRPRPPRFYGFTKNDLNGYFEDKPPPCEFNVVIDNQTLEVIARPDY